MAKPRKAQPKPQAKAKALQEDVRHEPAGAAASRRRQLERRDTEMQVDRILETKFGSMPAACKDAERSRPGRGGGRVTTGTAAQCN